MQSWDKIVFYVIFPNTLLIFEIGIVNVFNDFKKKRLISDIDLVLRTTEMRLSKGPVYAMSQAQMLLVEKLNPELKEFDLEIVLKKYETLIDYRKVTNPIHQ